MSLTTITIQKKTADKIRQIAKKENRSISAQIDYILTKYVKESAIHP